MKHQLVRFFTIFSLLTLLFGAVPAAPVGAEAHAVPLAASGDSLWAKSVGGTDHEYPAGIATDSNGNVYVTGSFRETADFDPGAGSAELTSAGDYDIFLLKLDGNGNYAWAKRIGSTGIDGAASIAADASNNIYVTGVFSGTVDFDPGAGAANLTSAGLRDIFVAKYDSDGNYIWAKRMGGGTNDSGLGLTVDAGGNVYTTGNYQGTADFDPGAGTANLTSAGNADVFVSKLDSNGNFVWAKSMGGTDSEQGRGIAVSASGNVYTIGNFEGAADFDPGAGTANLTSAGADDVFISKLDSSGNFVWAKRIGGTDYEEVTAIAMDAEENIYTTGKYELTVDFDPGAGTFNLTSAGGGGDIFISKLDSGGNFVWAKSTGGAEFERGESIVLDANNNVYLTGVFSGTVDFDPGAGTFNLTGPGGEVFISILDQNGDFITARRMGGASYDSGTAITLDAQENIFVTGSFYETADFDPELTSAGDADVFIVKLGAYEYVSADIDVTIGGISRGSYYLEPGENEVLKYGLTAGPVEISSDNGVGIIASLNQWRRQSPSSPWTGVTQSMALPVGLITNKYVMPRYVGNDPTLYNAILMANVDTVPRDITVTIGGTVRGTYTLGPSASEFVVYNGVVGGPVVVSSDDGAKIVASLYELKRGVPNVGWNGQSEMMGLPFTQLSDRYLIPIYFGDPVHTALNARLFIANADTVSREITVRIGGILRGTYTLHPNTSQVLKYPVNGAVEVSGPPGSQIIASLNQWRRQSPSSPWTGIAQSMALPVGLITNKYVMPRYVGNDPTLYNAILMANVDTVPRDITVTIGGTVQGTYTLGPSASEFVVYNGVVGGPVVVSSDDGAKIVASLYELKRGVPNVGWNGQSEMMGLPFTQLSDRYLIPIYFGDPVHTALDARLFIAVP